MVNLFFKCEEILMTKIQGKENCTLSILPGFCQKYSLWLESRCDDTLTSPFYVLTALRCCSTGLNNHKLLHHSPWQLCKWHAFLHCHKLHFRKHFIYIGIFLLCTYFLKVDGEEWGEKERIFLVLVHSPKSLTTGAGSPVGDGDPGTCAIT